MKTCSVVRRLIAGWLLLGACVTQAAAPEDETSLFDMSLEDLMTVEIDTVYSASKHTQKVSEAPSSVTIISAEEIRKYGYRTLAEVLRSVPGFYINNDRNYDYLGVRGFRRPGDYDTRILLLVDGFRINENIGDSPLFGTQFLLDVDLIERVEVIRGPGSSLYGSNALLAVINVITKNGKALHGLEMSGEVASYDTQKGRLSYGEVFGNGLNLLVSATKGGGDGPELYFQEFDDPATANGLVRNDDSDFHNLLLRASFGDFGLIAAHTAAEKGIPTAPWDAVFGDHRTRTYDDTTLLGLIYEHEISDKLSVKAQTAYHHYNYDGRYVYDYSEDETPYLVVNKDFYKGRWWDSELQVTTRPFEKHILTAGGEFRYNIRQDQANWDEEVYLDDSRHSRNWGLYIQDEFRVLDDVTLVAGVRYDHYSTFGGSTNPRLAMIYDVSEQTTLKLLYGRAFRAPNAYELYYHDGGYSQKAPLELDPETIDTYEIVLERALASNLNATLNGFYYVMDDLIGQYTDPDDGLLVFRNIEEVEARGVELALAGRWENGLGVRTSYSYVEAENKDTEETLVDSPRHLAKLNLIAPVVKDTLFAGLEIQYNGRSRTLAGEQADDFLLTNLALTYTSPSKRLEIAAGLYNLFDVDYSYPAFGEHRQDQIEQDGRTFRIRLLYRF
ncbi:MAG TPA: TonB-dependent receptor [Sedimentisphaerales bacterium]|nr:TonB-dependent receptor [Sedimentisphaerales bacterium]HRS12251.1 TonB-dependent receptor [Sedimentisphaerales bacterium]HRV48840.1 TonB-dependent receptor [Sedimentisphaerales bacterium]